MKRKIIILWILVSSLLYADDFQPIPDKSPGKRIYDATGKLTAAQIHAIEARIFSLEKKHGSQIAILLIDSTSPETIEAFSIRVFEKWKPGRQKIDDGVLMIFAMHDRKMRIETGYGLESVLPDAICRRITNEIIKPEFKQGDYYSGISKGVDAVITRIEGGDLPAVETRDDSFDNSVFVILTSVFLLVGLLVSWFASKKLFALVILAGTLLFVYILGYSGFYTAYFSSGLAMFILSMLGSIFSGKNKRNSSSAVNNSNTPNTWSNDTVSSSSSFSSSDDSWSSSSDSSSSSDFGGGDSGGGGSSDSW